MKREPVLIIGAGGHARVVISVIEHLKGYAIKGVIDRKAFDPKEKILGYPLLGSSKDLKAFHRKGIRTAAIAIGDNQRRAEAYRQLKALGFKLPSFIHPYTFVEKNVRIGAGALICAGAIVATSVTVGDGVIVNTGSIVDHESILESFVHVAPGCALAGRVRIGQGAFIGLGSRVIEQIKVGKWTTVGAGSVVVSHLPDGVVAYGVPARVRGKS
jgi:UDP-perosamine 4-acetyltransferase